MEKTNSRRLFAASMIETVWTIGASGAASALPA